jgi:RimJ/RimL family protein N-acetyltransferase
MAVSFDLPPALRRAGFSLRPEQDADIAFLFTLYASTREAELAIAPWPPEQKQAFLESQFAAQRHHYRTYFPDCLFAVLEQAGAPVGRLYLDERPNAIEMVDIALLPAWCGQGTGSAIIQAVMRMAEGAGKGVGIFVEKFNPALRLYQRLDFQEIEDHGVHLEMRWRPANLS